MDCAAAGFGSEIAVKSIATASNATKNFVSVDRRTIVSSLDNGMMRFTAAAVA